jgi:hypothetical protein
MTRTTIHADASPASAPSFEEAFLGVRNLDLVTATPEQVATAANTLALAVLCDGAGHLSLLERREFMSSLKAHIKGIPLPTPLDATRAYTPRRSQRTSGIVGISKDGIETTYIDILALTGEEM